MIRALIVLLVEPSITGGSFKPDEGKLDRGINTQ